MGIFSNFLKENKEEQKPLITIDKELSKLAVDLVGVALVPLKSNDMSGEYARLCNLGLGNSANAKFLKDRMRDIDAYNRNIIKAREFLGNSVILVSRTSFYKLCRKYGLSIGRLEQFTGVIPDDNLKELSDIKYKMDNYSGYVKLDTNKNMVRIIKIYNTSDKSDSDIHKCLDYNFNIVPGHGTVYNMNYIEGFENEKWGLDVHYIRRDEVFIACPIQEKVVIVSHPVDPIIFQYCPFGVLMWGKEAEDKVFEEYKKLRAIK